KSHSTKVYIPLKSNAIDDYMSGRKANKGHRCDKCRMKESHCICEHLVPMEHITPVTILMHFRERITTTNTGKIAHFLLKNSDIHYRGLIDSPLKESDVLKENHT